MVSLGSIPSVGILRISMGIAPVDNTDNLLHGRDTVEFQAEVVVDVDDLETENPQEYVESVVEVGLDTTYNDHVEFSALDVDRGIVKVHLRNIQADTVQDAVESVDRIFGTGLDTKYDDHTSYEIHEVRAKGSTS